jgi:signal transduction histidine kinase
VEHRWSRLAVAAALVLLAALELESLARTLDDRGEMERRVRGEVARLRSEIEDQTRAGGREALARVAATLPPGVAAHIEVFEPTGRLRQAFPAPSGVRLWPEDDQLRQVRAGRLSSQTVPGPRPRVLTYMAVDWAGEPAVLRLVSPDLEPFISTPDHWMIPRHVAVLLLLLTIGALALLPAARSESAGLGAGMGALRAYEEAMGRLQAQGAAESLRHEQERRRLRTALDDKDAMARAGELTSGIVHEVRNGLGTIVGYAQLIEKADVPDAAASARRIREECATLEIIVRRFVDFVKTEDLRLASFDLGRMLSRVAARESRGRPGGRVSLPQPMPEVTLMGDEEMLERAFENLVRNARAATGEGGQVVIDLSGREHDVVVLVADDGPGMPAEQRASIRPFTSSKGGLGLGLATAFKIVRLHAGDLLLGERRPHGLEVSVRLPRRGPDED